MRNKQVVISFFTILILCFVSCRLEQDRNVQDPLNCQVLGLHTWRADSLKLTILSNDTIDYKLLKDLENQYSIGGREFRVIPYYMLKLKEDNTGTICYNIYRITCAGNESLTENNRVKLKQMGIKYLKLGAELNDSICIRELKKIQAL